MDALIRSVERVVEAAEWFVRTPSLRVLYVQTSGMLRNVVLKHLAATELLDVNTCPFFVLEAPTEPGDDGWLVRTEELRGDWQHLIETAPEPTAVASLWPEQAGQTPLVRFGRELVMALSDLRSPMSGLVIVLAPVWIRDAARWRDDLTVLLGAASLAQARFVIVEAEETHSLPVIENAGALAEIVDARVDDTVLRREADVTLAAASSAPPGATGHQLVGGAGPPVRPPRRRRQPPPLSDEQRDEVARQLGLSPAALDVETMRQVRTLVLSAAAAMRDGKLTDAVRIQREARDYCAGHGLVREAVVNELVLAAYALQGGHSESALDIFRLGRERAERAGLVDMAVQAQMATAACLLVLKRIDDSAAAYAEAGILGASGSAPALTIEAYRMCGQLLASMGQTSAAVTAFQNAIAVAEEGGESTTSSSSAGQAMLALAAIYRQRGVTMQAESLEAQAAALASADSPPAEPIH